MESGEDLAPRPGDGMVSTLMSDGDEVPTEPSDGGTTSVIGTSASAFGASALCAATSVSEVDGSQQTQTGASESAERTCVVRGGGCRSGLAMHTCGEVRLLVRSGLDLLLLLLRSGSGLFAEAEGAA